MWVWCSRRDGNTLYAGGGRGDAIYAYGKSGASWVQTAKISLGHTGGIGIGVSSSASGLGSLAPRPNAVMEDVALVSHPTRWPSGGANTAPQTYPVQIVADPNCNAVSNELVVTFY